MRMSRSFHSNSANLATPKLTGLVTRLGLKATCLVDPVAMSVNAPFQLRENLFYSFYGFLELSQTFFWKVNNYCQNMTLGRARDLRTNDTWLSKLTE